MALFWFGRVLFHTFSTPVSQIASALASGREILLLDEPTGGLDYVRMMETAELLKKLRETGKTILVVTHDSELIHACCSRKITFGRPI